MSVRSTVPAMMAFALSMALASSGWAKEPVLTRDAVEGSCEESCDGGPSSCPPACERGLQIYGDLLYLRPRNGNVEYAVPINGTITPTPTASSVPAGRTASLDPQFQTGFRFGGGFDFDCGSNISATFTHYENTVDDSITGTPTIPIRSLVSHPNTANAATDWLDASAHQFMRFNMADLDYRHEFYCSERANVNYLVGVRYANLTQKFNSQFSVLARDNVDTNVNFDGGGFRLGIEGERHAACRNVFVYGKAAASFLGGEFRADYLQASSIQPVPEAETNWKEARMVSILECEVGLGWVSPGGHFRASAGYMVSGWLNVVKTSEFISAVQANQFHGPDKINGNDLVFDGLVTRAEVRW